MDTTFETIWVQEEQRGLQRRLRQDYPAWLRRRRQKRRTAGGLATGAAIALFAAVAPYNNELTTKEYESVYCIRAGTTDAQWVALAGKTLTRAMI
jgi:hypothetical protein